MSERRIPAWTVALALAALVAWSFAERWQLLTASPFPVGVDGYYYPLQLRSLLETGHLAYPASPLALWLMLPFAALTDPLTGAKLGAAVLGALVAVPAYGVGARLGRSRGAGLVAAVLATTSAGSAYLTIEFVKNGVGLTMALTALWLVLAAIERPTWGRFAGALAGAIAAVLAHKMAAGIVLAIAVPAAIGAAAGRGELRGRRLLTAIAIAVAAAIALGALGLAFPERFLSPGDAGLVRGLLSADAHWAAPALATGQITLGLGHEALLGGAVALAAAVMLTRRGRRAITEALRFVAPRAVADEPAVRATGDLAAAWAVVALGAAIALPWLAVSDPQGLGFRLRIAAFVPLALGAAIVAGRLPVRRRELALGIAAVVLALRVPGDRDEGRITTHPALVTAALAMPALPRDAVAIVPERHIAFMIAWYARVEVRLRPEGVPPAQRWRVLPLALIGMDSPLDRALLAARGRPELVPPHGLHPRHPNGLVLVVEPTWDWVLASLPADDRARWTAWPTI